MIRVEFEVTGPTLAALEERAHALIDMLNGEGHEWQIDMIVRPTIANGFGDVAYWTAEVEAVVSERP